MPLGTTAAGEEWHDDLASAHAAIAARDGLSASDVDALRMRANVDPIVIHRDGARWRSAAVWQYRTPSGTVRLFEMLRVDEAQYEH